MSDRAKLMEETKKNIRGLIISSPVGLTVRELKTDYESFIGKPLPYRQLGFNTLEDFFEDIKDTVCVSYEKGKMVLRAPSDPTTQHIERLVSRQKITNKKKWAVLRKPPPKRNTYRPSPVVPSQLRHQIQELFKSYSDGLPLTHFETCFSRRFGYQLDYKKNRFSTLSEMLESIPSIVKLVGFQNGEVRVVPVKSKSQSYASRRPTTTVQSSVTPTTTTSTTVTSSRTTPVTTVASHSQQSQRQQQHYKPVPTLGAVHTGQQPVVQPQTTTNIPSLLSVQPRPNLVSGPRLQNQPVRYMSVQAGNMMYPVPFFSNVYVPTSSVPYLSQQSLNPAMAMSAQQVQTPSFVQQVPTPAVPQPTYHSAAHPQPNYNSAMQHQQTFSNSGATQPQFTFSSATQAQSEATITHKDNNLSSARQHQLSGISAVSTPSDQSFDSIELMFDDDSGIPLELQEEIRQVLEARPEGVWASRLLSEYKTRFKKELPFREQGFHSVVEFVSTLPQDLVTIERPIKQGDWRLMDSRLKREIGGGDNEENIQPSSKVDKQNPREDSIFRESVRQVLQLHPEGILMQDFPAKYKEMTGRTLKDKITYFGSLDKMCLSLTDDVLQINYKGDGLLKLHAIHHSDVSRRFDKLLNTYQPHATTQEMKCMVEDDLPVDAVGPGTYYTQVPLPDLQDYIEIYVSNIVSPGVFWIQFREKNHTMALEKLMDDLEFYRTSSGNQYKMPPSLIAVGQVVAVIFPEDDNWHRGIITSIRTIDFVDVYYVDYGNTCSVHKKNLRLLRGRYLKLPAQAVQARLANIQPTGEKWTEQSKLEMLKICINKPVIALVTGSKNRVLSVCVTDTMSDEDLHVNDHLVSEGYAVFAPDELQTSSIYPEDMLEIPDDSLLYGSTDSQNDAPLSQSVPMATTKRPEANSSDASGFPSSSEGGSQRFIQLVELTSNICIHVINWDKEPWLLSAEISALFWDDDILRSMLQTKRLLVKKQVLSRSEQPALFQELIYYGVKSVNENKTYVTIYSLKRLPELLDVFHHPQPEIKSRVEEIVRDFDPDDLYWQGEDADMAADIQRELEETQLGVDELKLTLQALQFKRKRILQSLLSVTGSESDYVNQLHEVEMQINKTKELMEEVEATLGCDVQDVKPSSKPSLTTDTSKSVKTNIVAPLIVNTVSPQKRTDSVSLGDSSRTSTPGPAKGNMMTTDQFLQSMITAQANMPAIDPSLYAMYGLMQNSMMQQIPSLGRGQPINFQLNSEGQNVQMLPGLQSLMNCGLADMTSNQSMNSMNSGVQNRGLQNMNTGVQANVSNINMGVPDLQTLMAMPSLQTLMTTGTSQHMPNVPANPRLQTPQTVPTMTNFQNMANMSGGQAMPNMGSMSGFGNLQGMMVMPGVGAGQESNAQNMALLPELIPLLNNLNIGTNPSQGNQ